MIDLHTHILPGVDDGAPDLETALAMARFGQSRGLAALAATPHFYWGTDWPTIKKETEILREEFKKAQLELDLISGAEILIDLDILEKSADQIPTYGDQGKFCLIEFPMHQIPIYTNEVLFNLMTKGITPIIAHPERYAAVVDDPNTVLDWLQQGCLIQINSGSILGRFGSAIRKTAEIMLAHGMVHFAASDAHSLGSRCLNLPESLEAMAEIIGQQAAVDLVKTNPRSIWEGNYPPIKPPRVYRGKKRFFFF